jgi:hypothetical protein
MLIDIPVILVFSFFFFLVNYTNHVLLGYSLRSRMPMDTRVFKFLSVACGAIFVVVATYAVITEYVSRSL